MNSKFPTLFELCVRVLQDNFDGSLHNFNLSVSVRAYVVVEGNSFC